MDASQFITRWSLSSASERSNKDSYLKDLADVLGVTHPEPRTGDRSRDRYVFEADAVLGHEGGTVSIGKMDLYKAECFVLEAKQGSNAGSTTIGHGRRHTPGWSIAMQDAYGQALNYARTLPKPPPFLIVADIGFSFDLYASFDESGIYRPFPDGQNSRLYLADLPRHIDTLRAVWTDPYSLDPARKKAKVTREIAGHIAELASALEDAGHAPEIVAKFLMRCLFTMFAEDVGLLPEGLFTNALETRWCRDPGSFPAEVVSLWTTMNTGGNLFGAGRILQFNGGLFADPVALPLDAEQLQRLLAAAKCDWSNVEPAIFGTLLERALSKAERHSLGAHYTPRTYVERLVRPTIEEPLRRDLDTIRVEARMLASTGKVGEARAAVGGFHKRLCELRVLDPACGTGNFLYVALDVFKSVESEALALLAELGDTQAVLGARVSPAQFMGIEVNPWAREIAELVLWIGHLSWNARISGKAATREPVLQDYGNIECRDAVLAWDRIDPVLDDAGRPVTRWDGLSMKKHPVTGKDVPSEDVRVPVVRYVGASRATWPATDFVVGNPPFIGTKRMRAALGDGYVDALRATYGGDVEDNADLVMYWWQRAATLCKARSIVRFGLITTNSITGVFNRRVVESFLEDGSCALRWAVADHPWAGESDGAAVRIAMTVGERAGGGVAEIGVAIRSDSDVDGVQISSSIVGRIHADLSGGANFDALTPLASNGAIASMGVALHGSGFIVEPAAAAAFRVTGDDAVVPYLGGRDLLQRPRERYLLDFTGLDEDAARHRNPAAFQHLLVHVKPERDQNRRDQIRRLWWRFGWERPVLRRALSGLPRFIATTETSKHRVFQFIDAAVLPDHKVVAVALDDAFFLGVLSSRVHVSWATATGGRLGVGNDPIYNKTKCFDAFPFPICASTQSARVTTLGERLDAHRKAQQAAHSDLTLTAMYNVLEKLRADEPLTDKERVIHDQGLVSILREVQDNLDAAVLDAYGWPHDIDDATLLVKLVALNAERAAEERRGLVRWLRPGFQRPADAGGVTISLLAPAAVPLDTDTGLTKWPAMLSDRVTAVRDVLDRTDGTMGVEAIAKRFKGARRADVEAILDSLSALGIAVALDVDGGRRWRRARMAA